MTAATGFRRLGLALLAVIALGAGALGAASFLVSPDAVRSQALNEIHAVTGLAPTLRGKTTVRLFPTGSVSFDEVALGDADKPALTARRLTARLRFFPLLVGRAEIADLTLVRPTIAVDIEPDGRSNWGSLIGGLAGSQKPNAERGPVFSEIRIRNGTVVINDKGRNLSETFEHVVLSLAWPSISKSFGASGRFVWHD